MTQLSLAEAYYEKLPLRPWASNNVKQYGIQHYARRFAAKRSFIQTNPPHLLNSLVFDIDKDDGKSFGCWIDGDLPEPNIWVGNPENGHGHAIYMLSTPIYTGHNARPDPLAFVDAVTDAYTERLGADSSFTNFIAKNPLSEAWKTLWLHGHTFPLTVLAEYVDLTKPASNEKIVIGSRNCTLFDQLRLWAYGEIHTFSTWAAWSDAVLNQAKRLNTFSPNLPYSEIKATAKSVAKWVYNHHGSFASKVRRGRDGHGLTRHDGYNIRTKQYRPTTLRLPPSVIAERQKLAAANTNAQRKSKTSAKVEAGIIMLRDQQGIELPSLRQIAKASGVSLDSVYRHYPELKTKLQMAA